MVYPNFTLSKIPFGAAKGMLSHLPISILGMQKKRGEGAGIPIIPYNKLPTPYFGGAEKSVEGAGIPIIRFI